MAYPARTPYGGSVTILYDHELHLKTMQVCSRIQEAANSHWALSQVTDKAVNYFFPDAVLRGTIEN